MENKKDITLKELEAMLNDPTPVKTHDEEVEAFLDTLDWSGIGKN